MEKLDEAIGLRERGEHEAARDILLQLVVDMPMSPEVWYQCAWIHDVMGLEREAAPYYVRALELGIMGEDRQGAFLGLGSTYRTLGMYEESKAVLERAMAEFPAQREYPVFYAMTLYNLQEHSQAMQILLEQLAETSADQGVQTYRKAIAFYADKLDQRWD
ncbi:tetratricopeptide repeat protein [Paenibacillus guangzhouensis]|uniref:tetratricopeptide repeat protein n=1 Tax=Paenibacillus guangzhouensis TaxID=1473112 RepID=UPI0012668B50|nr:tetratricopeptide repeat protein [Paenibacillus guangzhouensis]